MTNLSQEIQELDLSYATYNLVVEKHWRYDKALRAEHEFRLMLELVLRNPTTPVVPTQLADHFWH
ncbi:hypothetical protein ABTO89_19195, partial [Acinetobacter baumannii]